MKKVFCLACLRMALALLPALAMAQEAAVMSGGTELIDWTALVVAVIGVIGTAVSALIGRVWVKYVRPWLEQRDLTDAAKIVVEAVEALLAHCFTELGAERVWCAYFDGNEKSRRCQEKCGFRFHHTERDVHWAATDEIKTEHYSILTRTEWLARQKPED